MTIRGGMPFLRCFGPICLLAQMVESAPLPRRCQSNSPPEAHEVVPLLRTVDLSVGETVPVQLRGQATSYVKLVDLSEHRDSLSGAVRWAEVTVEVDGVRSELVVANYHLPKTVGAVQIDCSVTRGYASSGRASSWALDEDARLRLWPAGSPWIRPGTFTYPVRQRWFATSTQMANEPTFVDGGDTPSRKQIYYHSGLDIGGAEGRVEILAATDGLVVSSGGRVLEGHLLGTPIRPRYDVVYVQDARGWYYRYSHLKNIEPQIEVGRLVSMGDRIGVLGKEGRSGGWSHLHFEIKARQPSGRWGTQAGYAFLWEAYLRKYHPPLIAVARPHHFVAVGEKLTLDASRSWSESNERLKIEWQFCDGTRSNDPKVSRVYDQIGSYSEVLRVEDETGNVDYDFAVVQVIDPQHRRKLSPVLHATHAPTFDLRVGDPVAFSVRAFRAKAGEERWDFGDGSDEVSVRSGGKQWPRAADGYAVIEHRYAHPGDYIATVRRTNEHGSTATAHLHVRVGPAR